MADASPYSQLPPQVALDDTRTSQDVASHPEELDDRWRETQWLDQDENRDARARSLIAHRNDVQILVTMSFWRVMATIFCSRALPPEPGIWPRFCSGSA